MIDHILIEGTLDEQETAEPDNVQDFDAETQQINYQYCKDDKSDYCSDFQEEGDNEKKMINYLNSNLYSDI